MLYNKNQFKKVNDKKVLHKIKKHWVTVSVALLGLIGGGAVATTNASANTDTQNDDNQANHQLNSSLLQNQRTQLLSDQVNHSNQFTIHNNSNNTKSTQSNNVNSGISSNTPQDITKEAQNLYQRVLNNATQRISNNSSLQNKSQQSASSISTNYQSSISGQDSSNITMSSQSSNLTSSKVNTSNKNSQSKFIQDHNYLIKSNKTIQNSPQLGNSNASQIMIVWEVPSEGDKVVKEEPQSDVDGTPFNYKPFLSTAPTGYTNPKPDSRYLIPKAYQGFETFYIDVAPEDQSDSDGNVVIYYLNKDSNNKEERHIQMSNSDGALLTYSDLLSYLLTPPIGYKVDNYVSPSDIEKGITPKGNLGDVDPSKFPMKFSKDVTRTINIEIVPNNVPDNQVNPAPINVHYINQHGDDVNTPSDNQPIHGSLNATVDVIASRPIPKGYHLAYPNEETHFTIGSNAQTVNIKVTGNQIKDLFTIHRMDNDNHNLSDVVIPINGIVGDKFKVDLNKYIPAGYYNNNSNHIYTGTILSNGNLSQNSIRYKYNPKMKPSPTFNGHKLVTIKDWDNVPVGYYSDDVMRITDDGSLNSNDVPKLPFNGYKGDWSLIINPPHNIAINKQSYGTYDFNALFHPLWKHFTNISLNNVTFYTNLTGTFSGGENSLKYIHLSNIFAPNATNLVNMIQGNKLQTVIINNFKAPKVSDANDMFSWDTNLKNVELSNISLPKLTKTYGMFTGDGLLNSLNLSNLDTHNVSDMHDMFSQDSDLHNLSLNGNFTTQNVSDMDGILSNDNNLNKITLGSNVPLNRGQGNNIPFFNNNISSDGIDSTKAIQNGVQHAGSYYAATNADVHLIDQFGNKIDTHKTIQTPIAPDSDYHGNTLDKIKYSGANLKGYTFDKTGQNYAVSPNNVINVRVNNTNSSNIKIIYDYDVNNNMWQKYPLNTVTKTARVGSKYNLKDSIPNGYTYKTTTITNNASDFPSDINVNNVIVFKPQNQTVHVLLERNSINSSSIRSDMSAINNDTSDLDSRFYPSEVLNRVNGYSNVADFDNKFVPSGATSLKSTITSASSKINSDASLINNDVKAISTGSNQINGYAKQVSSDNNLINNYNNGSNVTLSNAQVAKSNVNTDFTKASSIYNNVNKLINNENQLIEVASLKADDANNAVNEFSSSLFTSVSSQASADANGYFNNESYKSFTNKNNHIMSMDNVSINKDSSRVASYAQNASNEDAQLASIIASSYTNDFSSVSNANASADSAYLYLKNTKTSASIMASLDNSLENSEASELKSLGSIKNKYVYTLMNQIKETALNNTNVANSAQATINSLRSTIQSGISQATKNSTELKSVISDEDNSVSNNTHVISQASAFASQAEVDESRTASIASSTAKTENSVINSANAMASKAAMDVSEASSLATSTSKAIISASNSVKATSSAMSASVSNEVVSASTALQSADYARYVNDENHMMSFMIKETASVTSLLTGLVSKPNIVINGGSVNLGTIGTINQNNEKMQNIVKSAGAAFLARQHSAKQKRHLLGAMRDTTTTSNNVTVSGMVKTISAASNDANQHYQEALQWLTMAMSMSAKAANSAASASVGVASAKATSASISAKDAQISAADSAQVANENARRASQEWNQINNISYADLISSANDYFASENASAELSASNDILNDQMSAVDDADNVIKGITREINIYDAEYNNYLQASEGKSVNDDALVSEANQIANDDENDIDQYINEETSASNLTSQDNVANNASVSQVYITRTDNSSNINNYINSYETNRMSNPKLPKLQFKAASANDAVRNGRRRVLLGAEPTTFTSLNSNVSASSEMDSLTNGMESINTSVQSMSQANVSTDKSLVSSYYNDVNNLNHSTKSNIVDYDQDSNDVIKGRTKASQVTSNVNLIKSRISSIKSTMNSMSNYMSKANAMKSMIEMSKSLNDEMPTATNDAENTSGENSLAVSLAKEISKNVSQAKLDYKNASSVADNASALVSIANSESKSASEARQSASVSTSISLSNSTKASVSASSASVSIAQSEQASVAQSKARTSESVSASLSLSTANSASVSIANREASTKASESTSASLSASTSASLSMSTADSLSQSASTSISMANSISASNAAASASYNDHIIPVTSSVRSFMISAASEIASYNQVTESNADVTFNYLNRLKATTSSLASEKALAASYVQRFYDDKQNEQAMAMNSEAARDIKVWGEDPKYFTLYQAKPGKIINNVQSFYEPKASVFASATGSIEDQIKSLYASQSTSHASSAGTNTSQSANSNTKSLASVLSNDANTLNSYNQEDKSYVNTILLDLNSLNVSNNPILTYAKNNVSNYSSQITSFMNKESNEVGSLENHSNYSNDANEINMVSTANKDISQASLVANRASLVMKQYIEPLEEQNSSQPSSTSAGNSRSTNINANTSSPINNRITATPQNGSYTPLSLGSQSTFNNISSKSTNYRSTAAVNDHNDAENIENRPHSSGSDDSTSESAPESNVSQSMPNDTNDSDADNNENINNGEPADTDISDPQHNTTEGVHTTNGNEQNAQKGLEYSPTSVTNNSVSITNGRNNHNNADTSTKLPQTNEASSKGKELAEILLIMSAVLGELDAYIDKHHDND